MYISLNGTIITNLIDNYKFTITASYLLMKTCLSDYFLTYQMPGGIPGSAVGFFCFRILTHGMYRQCLCVSLSFVHVLSCDVFCRPQVTANLFSCIRVPIFGPYKSLHYRVLACNSLVTVDVKNKIKEGFFLFSIIFYLAIQMSFRSVPCEFFYNLLC